MDYSTTHIVFFSPTRTSAGVARAIGQGIGMDRRIETDLTYDLEESSLFIENALTVIAVPVYAGRVAPIAVQRLKRLRGANAPVIINVVYGNRDYEDALVELRDVVTEQGFSVLSAGAFVGEHSYSRPGMPIAAGRPDRDDIEKAIEFGKKSLKKLQISPVAPNVLYIKGNVPYREVGASTPLSPVSVQDLCSGCGECVEICPTRAIEINGCGQVITDKMLCIKCCACVKNCPIGARVFDTPYTAMLHEKFSARKEPEVFY